MSHRLEDAIHEACAAIRQLPATDAPLHDFKKLGIERGKYDATLPIREKLNELLKFIEPFDQESVVEEVANLPRLTVDSLVGEMENVKRIANEIPAKCQRQTNGVVPPSFHGAEAGVASSVEAIYSRIHAHLAHMRSPIMAKKIQKTPPASQDAVVKVTGVSSGIPPGQALGYFSPASLINAARKAHPAFKFATAAAGLVALVAVLVRFGISPATLVFGAIILVVLMVLFLIFSQATVVARAVLSVPAMVLVWSFLILAILTALFLFTSAFWNLPLPLRTYILRQLGVTESVEKEKIEDRNSGLVQQRTLTLDVSAESQGKGGDVPTTRRIDIPSGWTFVKMEESIRESDGHHDPPKLIYDRDQRIVAVEATAIAHANYGSKTNRYRLIVTITIQRRGG